MNHVDSLTFFNIVPQKMVDGTDGTDLIVSVTFRLSLCPCFAVRLGTFNHTCATGNCYPHGLNCSGQLQLATHFQTHWQAHAEEENRRGAIAAVASEAAAAARPAW